MLKLVKNEIYNIDNRIYNNINNTNYRLHSIVFANVCMAF